VRALTVAMTALTPAVLVVAIALTAAVTTKTANPDLIGTAVQLSSSLLSRCLNIS